uniref:Uncharacterized protein n=1 Tax=Chlamydomonas euryale TaxID=1486919 RepID=A0A7R9YUN7_9CHLO|mmetsp:Transcript_27579/g.81662  ORF Transcript_27579/g.81662 Transcript_27579/m.81662 type:complete len:112 (+) Transcript_27579:1-336(+)
MEEHELDRSAAFGLRGRDELQLKRQQLCGSICGSTGGSRIGSDGISSSTPGSWRVTAVPAPNCGGPPVGGDEAEGGACTAGLVIADEDEAEGGSQGERSFVRQLVDNRSRL